MKEVEVVVYSYSKKNKNKNKKNQKKNKKKRKRVFEILFEVGDGSVILRLSYLSFFTFLLFCCFSGKWLSVDRSLVDMQMNEAPRNKVAGRPFFPVDLNLCQRFLQKNKSCLSTILPVDFRLWKKMSDEVPGWLFWRKERESWHGWFHCSDALRNLWVCLSLFITSLISLSGGDRKSVV